MAATCTVRRKATGSSSTHCCHNGSLVLRRCQSRAHSSRNGVAESKCHQRSGPSPPVTTPAGVEGALPRNAMPCNMEDRTPSSSLPDASDISPQQKIGWLSRFYRCLPQRASELSAEANLCDLGTLREFLRQGGRRASTCPWLWNRRCLRGRRAEFSTCCLERPPLVSDIAIGVSVAPRHPGAKLAVGGRADRHPCGDFDEVLQRSRKHTRLRNINRLETTSRTIFRDEFNACRKFSRSFHPPACALCDNHPLIDLKGGCYGLEFGDGGQQADAQAHRRPAVRSCRPG